MKSYQEIKEWFANKENKQQLVIAVCFILVFIVGFGSGRYEREFRREKTKTQNNYTITSAKKPVNSQDQMPAVKQLEEGAVLSASSTLPQNCVVKGNISSAGKKIYHVSGGAFYKTVKPEQCFPTEGEAQAAGFVKSQR